jgi:RecQ family ATP-dependent DNA helicase
MTIDEIKRSLIQKKDNWDIIVLKGFPNSIYFGLADDFTLLDKYIFESNKINLKQIEFSSLLMKILTNTSTGIITFESLLNLNTNLRELNALNKRIAVFTNNLVLKIENPTTTRIPDFDSSDFQLDESNGLYSNYYSFCTHENGKEIVEYIEITDENDQDIEYINLIEPICFSPSVDSQVISSTKRLSANDGSLETILTNIFLGTYIHENQYIIEPVEIESQKERTRFEVLVGACKYLKKDIELISSQNDIISLPRKELYDLLKEIWNYHDFRNLGIYKDLSRGRDIIEISQGEIIETVLSEAEKVILNRNETDMRNILLTAPTGAGKSLLFQLAAIYLARNHGTLTIIISPLVALMNDQVNGLYDKYENVAALNSDKSPQDKSEILEKIQTGEINILYMAPELLLSYTISTFIGERRIGLLVVDEAHTVTTWGRDFRVDYWFLGEYIRKAKRNLGYSFPIFALTATAVWDPSGKNDMIFETIRSLHMAPCLKYIGVVRRENIVFDIRRFDGYKSYESSRNQLTANRITEFISENKKTIVYFPYKRTIREMINDCLPESIERKIAEYHADLDSNIKKLNAKEFKSGIRPVMCATKAFGMGIDVSDIQIVYHHAPTGALSDYVQEIGRLARDPNITGIAKIDFSDKDLKFIKTLHGLSTIRPYQLFSVLRKLMQLYNMKAEKRNMLISASDFEFIFPGKNVDYDQKVKSCLLLLENDLLNKYRFNSIIVRPKNIFSKAYIKIKNHY